MLNRLRFFCGWCLLFLLAGCVTAERPTEKDVTERELRISSLRQDKELLEQEQVAKQRQIDHFIERITFFRKKTDGEKISTKPVSRSRTRLPI